MLTLLRRRLVVLAIVTTILLLITFHLTYKHLDLKDHMPSFLDRIIPKTHTTVTSQSPTPTFTEYVMTSLIYIRLSN
jgi:hypothetical protein